RNPNASEKASVASGLAKALPPLLLEHAQFRAARLAVNNAQYFRAGDKRRACHNVTGVFLDEQYLFERESGSLLAGRTVDLDDGTRGDLQLPAVGLNDRVHALTSVS